MTRSVRPLCRLSSQVKAGLLELLPLNSFAVCARGKVVLLARKGDMCRRILCKQCRGSSNETGGAICHSNSQPLLPLFFFVFFYNSGGILRVCMYMYVCMHGAFD